MDEPSIGIAQSGDVEAPSPTLIWATWVTRYLGQVIDRIGIRLAQIKSGRADLNGMLVDLRLALEQFESSKPSDFCAFAALQHDSVWNRMAAEMVFWKDPLRELCIDVEDDVARDGQPCRLFLRSIDELGLRASAFGVLAKEIESKSGIRPHLVGFERELRAKMSRVSLADAMPKMLARDGTPGASVSSAVDDPITKEQVATLIGIPKSTIENRMTKTDDCPKAIIMGKGRARSVWSYAKLRPWLVREWPDKLYLLDEKYEAVKPHFS